VAVIALFTACRRWVLDARTISLLSYNVSSPDVLFSHGNFEDDSHGLITRFIQSLGERRRVFEERVSTRLTLLDLYSVLCVTSIECRTVDTGAFFGGPK